MGAAAQPEHEQGRPRLTVIDGEVRAAVYTRISSDRDGRGEGVQRQEEDCLEQVERNGWVLVDVYQDNDVSAYGDKERPAWTRLLADVLDGGIDVIVAWHDDRLWRNVVEQQVVFAQLADAGVGRIVAGGRTYRTASTDDSVMSGVQALLAQKESADKSRRIRRKLAKVAEEGRPANGGYRPFGYADDRVTVVPEEAELIREAARRILAGESIRGVRLDWNERGIRTVAGNEWSNTTMLRMMRSPRLAGLRQHRGEIVGEATWPGIISEAEHKQLAARLKRKRGKPARSYLLSGIARCGKCGASLASKRDKRKGRLLWCHTDRNGCGGIAVVAEPLEKLVRETLVVTLAGPKLEEARKAAAGDDVRLQKLADQLAADEAALESLARDLYLRTLTEAEHRAAREALVERIETARQELARDTNARMVSTLPSGEQALRDAWESNNLEWRRALVKAVLEAVVVNPAEPGISHFDPARVDLTWKV